MDEVMLRLMSNYLKQFFPVKRIKSGKRFKRGVNMDGHSFFLPGAKDAFKAKIYDSLKCCYAASDDEIRLVIERFYNIT